MVDILSDMLDFNFSIVSMFLIARYIYREKLFKRISTYDATDYSSWKKWG